jgi:transcriptional regulator with XRE-family HTH domain
MAIQKLELGPTGQTVADNLTRIRKQQQLHQRELAARLAAIGRPMLSTVISKIEQGDRRVDVDDLLALSAALNISPLDLLLPPRDAGEVDATGTGRVDAAHLWEWALGQTPLHPASTADIVAYLMRRQAATTFTLESLRAEKARNQRDARLIDQVAELHGWDLSEVTAAPPPAAGGVRRHLEPGEAVDG